MTRTVAIAGLGAIGLPLARALDNGVEGLRLIAVAARDEAKARARLTSFRAPPRIVELPDLAEADIVVEAAPAALFDRIALPAIESSRIFVPASVGALLPRMHLVRRAIQTGARIIVPTGALLGMDAVRAAAEGPVESVTIETRTDPASQEVRLMVTELGEQLGETPRMVVGKPGLDGHSNGAEQIALRARDVGFDVTYEGIRLTPDEIVEQALASKAHVVGLSILSGSHVPLVRDVMAKMRNAGLGHIPVVVGGIIPPDDENVLRNIGVVAVYTPKDYAMDAIMKDIVRIIRQSHR